MAQSHIARSAYGTVNGYTPERERISVARHVVAPYSTINTNTFTPDPQPEQRKRTQARNMREQRRAEEEKRLQAQKQREEEKPGIRMNMRAAIVMIASVCIVFACVAFSMFGKIAAIDSDIRSSETEIVKAKIVFEEKTAQYAAATDEQVICYKAARELHMIPASSVEPIHITAPDTRPVHSYTAQKTLDSMPVSAGK